jgi:hypothetical protein
MWKNRDRMTTFESGGLWRHSYWPETSRCRACSLRPKCTAGKFHNVNRWGREHVLERVPGAQPEWQCDDDHRTRLRNAEPLDGRDSLSHASEEQHTSSSRSEPRSRRQRAAVPGFPSLSFYTYGTTVLITNSAKWCQAGVMPSGTASAPAAKTIGAAHMVDLCTRRSESRS